MFFKVRPGKFSSIKPLIRYCSGDIIAKVNFSYTSRIKLQTGVFLKTLRKSNFLDSCFHGLREEPLNPQESIREKTHLVTIPLQE